MRRAAIQDEFGAERIFEDVSGQVQRYYRGYSGRNLYEIGAAIAVVREKDFFAKVVGRERVACEHAFAMYNRWNKRARRVVLCWLWLARSEGIVKDVRLLIANLIWEDRAVWSERAAIDWLRG